MASRRILLPRLLIFPLMVLGPFLAAWEVCGRGVKLEAAKGHRDMKQYPAPHGQRGVMTP